MCGIVGYLGTRNAKDIILNGLKRLEYRGYDSAGIALRLCENGDFRVFKDKGRVAHLESLVDVEGTPCLGIGHTRWATHGVPNQVNSHPQTSSSGRFFVVHNGVVDNYKELKSSKLGESVFESDTDTEVIAHLIERYSYKMNIRRCAGLAVLFQMLISVINRSLICYL